MKKRAFSALMAVLVILPLLVPTALAEGDKPIKFRDKVFEAWVRASLDRPEGDITVKEASGVEDLMLWRDGEIPEEEKIRDISDVANFPNLRTFSAHGNAIKDIAPLAKLTSLTYLDLGGNPLKSLAPIAKLTELKEMTIWYCGLADLSPLKKLTKLEVLDAKGNKIKDAKPLKGLTNLKRLDLMDNQIRDAGPLAGLTSLTALMLSGNPVKDWSVLEGIYRNLAESDFTPDQLSGDFEIPFDDQALEQKVRAAIGKKKGKITYGDISGLREVYASYEGGRKERKIRSIKALAYFPKLFKFEAFDQEISDLTPLKGLENLVILALDGCPVTDLAPLGGMGSLGILQLSRTGVSDLTPLSGLKTLGTLQAQGNRITDIHALANLTNLDALDLSYNNIADISALSGLAKLTSLRLAGNPIPDFTPIRDLLPNLTDRDFEPLFADDVPATPIEIADPAFEGALRRALNIFGRPITRRDAYPVRKLELFNEKTEASAFSDISPLKWFVNLEELRFNANPVTDFGALSGLTKLRNLDAGFLQVADITPLMGLTSLESLNLRSCPVADAGPLANLTKLRFLDLADTRVADVAPLAKLTNLRMLYLSNCPAEDLSPLKAIYKNLEQNDFTIPK